MAADRRNQPQLVTHRLESRRHAFVKGFHHIHRLGKRLCVINPKDYTMSDAVAFMTGAKEPPEEQIAA